MLISCPYCGGMHPRGYNCPRKPKRRYRYEDREAYKVHRSNRWTELSLSIRKRDRFLCVYCLRHDKRVNNRDIEVHHITAIESDNERAYDRYNLIALCREHHEQAEKGLIDVPTLERMAQQQEDEDSSIG